MTTGTILDLKALPPLAQAWESIFRESRGAERPDVAVLVHFAMTRDGRAAFEILTHPDTFELAA
jgi:hypothetical protein